ncbi:hypothetical protein BJV74DRAFT_929491 [Russula compacta]|nr:hypothetical protein BJV74DRAFT_929491 [Russula compacta]
MIGIRDSGAESYGLAVAKFWHTLGGLYIWEFITTLDYEWSVIRGRFPYRWTIWLYSFTRVATLVIILLVTVVQDIAPTQNCQHVTGRPKVQMVTRIVLMDSARVAIWNRKKVVIWIAIGLWVTNFAFLIQGKSLPRLSEAHSTWVLTDSACEVPNVESFELTLMVTLTIDLVLLFIALLGLFLLHRQGGGRFGIVLLLWKQFALAIAAELPVGVSIIFDLGCNCLFSEVSEGFVLIKCNSPSNIRFSRHSIVMSIAATRMHRALVDFAFGSTDNTFDTLRNGGRPISNIEWTPASQSTVRRIEVAMHKTDEQYPAPQSNQHGSFIGTEGRHDRCHEMGEV